MLEMVTYPIFTDTAECIFREITTRSTISPYNAPADQSDIIYSSISIIQSRLTSKKIYRKTDDITERTFITFPPPLRNLSMILSPRSTYSWIGCPLIAAEFEIALVAFRWRRIHEPLTDAIEVDFGEGIGEVLNQR